MKHLKILYMLGVASCMVTAPVYASDLIVCQNELCSVVQPQINRTQYLNHIKSMLLTAPNGRIDFCEASPTTHLCKTDALRWKTLSDTNQFNMSIPNARINVVNNDVALDYVVEANNSYPRCMFSPLKLSLLPNKTLQIVSYVYNCNLLETEPTNIQKILTVDFIDLDHKVIGGSYLIQSGGALFGETKGYALMQLRDAKTSLPLVAKRYRNKAPSVPIPVVTQQVIPPSSFTPLWSDSEDAIFKNWNSRLNVYPPILDADLTEEPEEMDEIEEIENVEEELSLPPKDLAPQEALSEFESEPELESEESIFSEHNEEDTTLFPSEEPIPSQASELPIPEEEPKEQPKEPVQPAKSEQTISSILDDLLYTLPFDWLDDSQSTDDTQSLFEPKVKEKEPEVTKQDTPPEQTKEPQIVPVVPQEIVLVVPQQPVIIPQIVEQPIPVQKQEPAPAPVPTPVQEEPQQPDPMEKQIDFSQRRQNIFITAPQKSQPPKSFWERIGDAAVNMFYFEPIQ